VVVKQGRARGVGRAEPDEALLEYGELVLRPIGGRSRDELVRRRPLGRGSAGGREEDGSGWRGSGSGS
jgi:hypothetical protein